MRPTLLALLLLTAACGSPAVSGGGTDGGTDGGDAGVEHTNPWQQVQPGYSLNHSGPCGMGWHFTAREGPRAWDGGDCPNGPGPHGDFDDLRPANSHSAGPDVYFARGADGGLFWQDPFGTWPMEISDDCHVRVEPVYAAGETLTRTYAVGPNALTLVGTLSYDYYGNCLYTAQSVLQDETPP